jgi:thiamine biosynthesis lipoprotein
VNGCFRAMGSDMKWSAEKDLRPALGCFFEVVEACCSRFRDDSELSMLNRDEHEVVEISSLLQEVLESAAGAYELSAGLVDPTILDALEAAGYDRDLSSARRTALSPPARTYDWRNVVVGEGVVRRPPGLKIDLGGVAKSWTARKALDLAEGDCYIDAGGDLALRGSWLVGVEHGGGAITSLEVEDGGVATSGVDRRRWAGGHHIIDPFTRRPVVSDVIAATVVADDALTAETVARTIVLLGMWQGLGWAESVAGVRGALATTTRGLTVAIPSTKEVLA